MTRLLLIALIPLALAGCRSSCGGHASLLNPCAGKCATPVSYGSPVPTFPASYSVPAPASSYPVIPAPTPTANAAELPFPQETIPPPGLPIGGLPNGTRAVGLPK